MKLISKFHDFYDACLSMGQDEKIIFKRETKNIKVEKIHWRHSDYSWDVSDFFYAKEKVPQIVNQGKFHFCGKQIPFVKVKVFIYEGYSQNYIESFCYNIDQLESFIKKFGNEKSIDDFYKKHKGFHVKTKSNYEEMNIWFDKYSKKDYFDNYFKYECPYFVEYGDEIILNPVLKDFEFYKFLDTFQTFQEISMFISGVMGGQVPPMIQISDKVRLEKKGFDSVTSFRNMERK